MTGTFDHNVQVGGRQSHAVTHASDHCSSSNGKPESGYPHISKQYPLISKRYPVRYPWDILLVSIRYSFISRYILLRYPNIRIFFASLKISHKYLRISVDIKVCENVRLQISWCGDFPRISQGYPRICAVFGDWKCSPPDISGISKGYVRDISF